MHTPLMSALFTSVLKAYTFTGIANHTYGDLDMDMFVGNGLCIVIKAPVYRFLIQNSFMNQGGLLGEVPALDVNSRWDRFRNIVILWLVPFGILKDLCETDLHPKFFRSSDKMLKVQICLSDSDSVTNCDALGAKTTSIDRSIH